MIKIAVLGYGTVGSGVVKVLNTNANIIAKRAGQEVGVKYVLDLRDFPEDPVQSKIVHDFNVILDDPEISIVVETMGGTKPAYEFVKKALLSGKSVCTSNKELVAAYGAELVHIAKSKSVNFLFEASVGGGIPVIRPLNQSLTADRIEQINGILNGTTNYILTKMAQDGSDFDSVLREAQELGYAEKDPTADVEGYDACRKIAILSSLMTGRNVSYENIYTEGISRVTADDFVYAKAAGKSIKLLAMSKDTTEGTLAMVSPCMISPENPLYMVSGVFNAVCVRGNMLGDSMYYGRGAGKLPTASAVVSDVVDCARHQGKTIMCFWNREEAKLVDIGDVERGFFVRAKADAAVDVEAAFPGAERIQVEGRIQDCGYFTQPMKEKEFSAKYEALGDKVLGRIRLEMV